MGLTPTICRMLILLHNEVSFKGPLLTLGNQDVWADYEQLKSYFGSLQCSFEEVAAIPHTSRLLPQYPGTENFVHAKTFFQMMGINEYNDIDKFEYDTPRILHDLNAPVPAELEDKFNLIIDGGTLEHIFDVRQVMGNIVRMCRASGWVVHLTPVSNYIDHGFYSFSPCFFYDFYQANGFSEFASYILQLNPDNLCEPSPYFEYRYGMDMHGMLDPNRQVLIFFAAKKVKASDELVIPTQGIYASNANSEVPQYRSLRVAEIETPPEHDSIIERLVPEALLGLLKPVRPLLGAIRKKIAGGKRESVASDHHLRRL